ncbi:MAG TPA: hypothetical protein VMR51_00210 [Patescibacteria group bacterium]|jgi:hypothetical protein|nr:hypothetical protein [Patescibacteria group bacterium]
MLDPDFGWHLQTGNYIRQHGIPAHDLYSYTAQNFRWIDHEWGNDVLVSLFYSFGGFFLVSILYAGLWTFSLLINSLKNRMLVLLLATLALLPYAGVRAITWTVLFFALLLKILSSHNKQIKYFIPVLFIAWANLHAGFIAGLALLAYFAIKKKSRLLIVILLVSLGATLVNPYGLRLYSEVFRTVFDSSLHSQITEWGYITFTIKAATFVVLWATGFWIFARRPLKNWLGLGPILLAASVSASRNIPLFVIVTTNDLNTYWEKFKDELPDKAAKAKKIIIFVLVTVVLIWISGLTYLEFQDLPWKDREQNYPEQAVDYLQKHPCKGQLFNSYNYGGYLIWKLPRQPVFIDGRMPTWKNGQGQKYLNIYFKIFDDQNYQQQKFAEYNVRCVLISDSSDNHKTIANLKASGWKPVVRANGSVLLTN